MSHQEDFQQLAQALERHFAEGVTVEWAPDRFNDLALAAFRVQYETILPFRSFCDLRGCTPESVRVWQDVPAVPARAFKHLDLSVGDPEVVFLTSGTSRGSARRGRHLVPSASLYRASLAPPFERYVTSGERLPLLSLIPRPEEAPDSSLSFMIGAASEYLATETHWFVTGSGVLDEARMRTVARGLAERGGPVCLVGTALALLHMVERLEGATVAPLPEGSRIMETGGFKGLDRDVGRADLRGRVSSVTGVPTDRIVSEYGMTELLSQLYEPVLSEGPECAGVHVAPPWLKVRALDPVSLAEVEPGRSGLLAFFDLANAGSTCHVLTEDIGSVLDGRVRLEGRALGAESRGCSRAMDDLMASARSAS